MSGLMPEVIKEVGKAKTEKEAFETLKKHGIELTDEQMNAAGGLTPAGRNALIGALVGGGVIVAGGIAAAVALTSSGKQGAPGAPAAPASTIPQAPPLPVRNGLKPTGKTDASWWDNHNKPYVWNDSNSEMTHFSLPPKK